MLKNFLCTVLVLFLSLSIVSEDTSAAVKNTPTNGYLMFLNKEKITLYNKPNGKKKVYTVKQMIYENGKDNFPTWQVVKVKKVYKNGWSKVSYKNKKKTYTGYMKTSGLRPNYNSRDYVFIDKPEGANLKKNLVINQKRLQKYLWVH